MAVSPSNVRRRSLTAARRAQLEHVERIFDNPRLSILHAEWFILFIFGLGYVVYYQDWYQLLDKVLRTVDERIIEVDPSFKTALWVFLGLHIIISASRIYLSFWILESDKEFKCLITQDVSCVVKLVDGLSRFFVSLTPFLIFIGFFIGQSPHLFLLLAFFVSIVWDIFMMAALSRFDIDPRSDKLRHFNGYFPTPSFQERLKVWLTFDLAFFGLFGLQILMIKTLDWGDPTFFKNHPLWVVGTVTIFTVVFFGLEIWEVISLRPELLWRTVKNEFFCSNGSSALGDLKTIFSRSKPAASPDPAAAAASTKES